MRWGIKCHLTDYYLQLFPNSSFTRIDGIPQCWYGGDANPAIYSDVNEAHRRSDMANSNSFNKQQVSLFRVVEYDP